MNLKEETLEKNTIYTGRIITVRNDTALLPNGKRASREVVEHPGGVTIAALTPEGELLFVRQYRYPCLLYTSTPRAFAFHLLKSPPLI